MAPSDLVRLREHLRPVAAQAGARVVQNRAGAGQELMGS